jgi:hypothetical protein
MAKIGFESLNDEIFQSELKSLFKGKIFIGNFTEKRLCEPLKTYRDCILIDCKTEIDFMKDLRHLIAETNEKAKGIFVGVTQSDESSFTLWTELDEGPLGKFWFQVSCSSSTFA